MTLRRILKKHNIPSYEENKGAQEKLTKEQWKRTIKWYYNKRMERQIKRYTQWYLNHAQYMHDPGNLNER